MAPGELEEDVVEGGPAHADVEDVHALLVEGADRLEEGRGTARDRGDELPGVLVDVDHAVGQPGQHLARVPDLARGHRDRQPFTAHLGLELVGGPPGDHAAAIDDGDRVGQLVGLVQVLGGQQDGRPLGDEPLDDLPQADPAAWVEARRGFVEEDDGWSGHQRPGEIQPPSHAAGVGLRRAVGGLHQVELLEQLGRTGPRLGHVEVVEPTHHHQVLPACEVLVDGRVLAGQPDRAAHALGVGGDIDAVDRGPPGVGGEQRGEDADGRGLARTVRPEQPQHRPGRDLEVHTVERTDLARSAREHLDQAFSVDGCHALIQPQPSDTRTPTHRPTTFAHPCGRDIHTLPP